MLIPNKIPILLVSMTVCFVLCMQRVKCGPLTHHVDHKTAEMPELQPSNREVFENTPTYMKELYGLASQDTKRLDLLHDGDSVRSFFDEGKQEISKILYNFLRGDRVTLPLGVYQ